MKYILTDTSVVQITESTGTIQNCSGVPVEVSNSSNFTDSLILYQQNKSTFNDTLYVKAYGSTVEQPIEINVVPFFFVSSGGGVDGEVTEGIENSLKSLSVSGNRVNFYTSVDRSGNVACYFDLPEEICLNQLGTELVENFSWSAVTYPNSTNPNLDGKVVLVLAVRGDKETNPTVNYSFVSLEKLIDVYTNGDETIDINGRAVKVKISKVANNAITVKSDGLHVDISNKIDKVTGKDLSTNDYTTAEKNKLAGIEANANKYVLPTASSSVVGGMKLYSDIGTNTDGTMTQAAIKTAIEEGNSATKIIVGASDSTVNAATTNGNTYLRLFDDDTARNSIKIAGSGAVSISSDASGNISVGLQESLKLSTYSVVMARKQDVEVTTLDYTSDCTITAVPADNTIATVSVAGGTITISGVATGNTIIVVSMTKNTSTVTKIIGVEVTEYSAVLDENTWAQISTVSQNGQGDLLWDVGDCKEIELNGNIGSCLTLTNQNLCVFILHFNYAMNGTAENNIIWGGFKSALTDGIDVALVDSKYNSIVLDGTVCFNMNHTGQRSDSTANGYYSTNYGGWKGSDLRYDILGATLTAPSEYNQLKSTANVGYDATAATLSSPKADTLLAALPSDLRSVLRLWTRWVDAVGNSSNADANIKPTVDAITLLAEFEVFGSRSYANSYEKNHQLQMDYYAAGNGKKRYKHNNTSSAVWWWECSPSYTNVTTFTRVTASGGANRDYAYYSGCVAPAFKT